MQLLKIWPPVNTVQDVSQYLIDLGESGQSTYFAIQVFLFYGLVFLSLCSFVFDPRKSLSVEAGTKIWNKILTSEFLFCSFIVVFVLSFRVPLAVLGIQNPDEPLWVAEAKTLSHDLRPWVSADSGTGGPLVPMTLLSLKLVGLSIDEGTLKITAGIIVSLCSVFLYLALTHVMTSKLSRLIVLPLVVAFAVMVTDDMVAYNSEHPVILLLSLSLLFLARLYTSTRTGYVNIINIVCLGFLLGLVPFAKLQGAPMAFFIGSSALVFAYQKTGRKHALKLIVSALLPALIMLVWLFCYQGLTDFWASYIQNNLFYVSKSPIGSDGILQKLSMLVAMTRKPEELNFFFCYSILLMLVCVIMITWFYRKISKQDLILISFAILFLTVSLYCVITPGRPFTHYTLLLLIPIISLTAFFVRPVFLLIEQNLSRFYFSFNVVIFVAILICTIYYFHVRFTRNPSYLSKAAEYYQGYAPTGIVGVALQNYYSPGMRLATWEYECELFEGTDFLMGARYATFPIGEGPLFNYYLDTYLKDLNTNKPELFVESFYNSINSFTKYSDVKSYIESNYRLEDEIGGYRIFIRRGSHLFKKPWSYRENNTKYNESEFHFDIHTLERNGTFLVFGGWAVLGGNSNKQEVSLALINKSDTIWMNGLQTANKSIVDFSPNNVNNLMCGFLGLIPLREIPTGNYQIGLQVKNNDKAGFTITNKFFNQSPL